MLKSAQRNSVIGTSLSFYDKMGYVVLFRCLLGPDRYLSWCLTIFFFRKEVLEIYSVFLSAVKLSIAVALYPSCMVKLLYQLLKLNPGTLACDTFLEYKTIPFADNPIIIILRTVKARITNIIKEQPLGEQ